ncbi:arginine--tRNA ligase [Marivibrio halodurans]|uniref:Arginine--tRNA ligase n=1 Tax=Marivibrio halodurans TaxID=2039722 RepID=A0A8J7S526_9PROT|nr:arginine--tRNA ligase [Marivibrio halodurans]MBP5855742.1 arginine--tRNA ligase [Marivibrio halodurans]
MNVFKEMKREVESVLQALKDQGDLPEGTDFSRVAVEPPRDPSHGDMATNAAMVLAKPAGLKPRDLAEKIAAGLSGGDWIESAEIAGPGFINLRLKADIWHRVARAVLTQGPAYGDGDAGGGEPVIVEYVSANPTGPLHIGHARGAVFGDVLARLLDKAGYAVTKEYWINDAGVQIDILARSAFLRYREALGQDIGPMPEGLYPGDYLVPVGEVLKREHGAALLEMDEDGWMPIVRDKAVAMMMDLIRATLADLGVEQDVFTSERGVIESGKVDDALAYLEEKGLIYIGVLDPPKGKKPDDWEERPQTLFRASRFGDDTDRPLKKSDGSWTYFASDIAYHRDKYNRGFKHMVLVLGADHGGYVKRMQAVVKAVSGGEASLTVKLCQMVKLLDKGEPVKMSKRAGSFVTLQDLIDSVGRDVVRFFLLTRKNDAPMDFDLSAVKEQSRDNMVFYVHYAHARCRSVFRQAEEAGIDTSAEALAAADLSRLDAEPEFDLMKRLAEWPRAVEAAAEAEEPHRIAYYLYDTASAFHALWTRGKEETTLRFIQPDDPAVTIARLALVEALRTVIASGLDVFGVTPVDELS